jgi:hypothetical protein
VYQLCWVLAQLAGLQESMVVELPPGLFSPVSTKRRVSFAPRKPVTLFPTLAVRIGDDELLTAVFGTP